MAPGATLKRQNGRISRLTFLNCVRLRCCTHLGLLSRLDLALVLPHDLEAVMLPTKTRRKNHELAKRGLKPVLHQRGCISESAGSFKIALEARRRSGIFSMFMFLNKRSCVNQTASFCRAGFWVWFELVSLVPLLGSSKVYACSLYTPQKG